MSSAAATHSIHWRVATSESLASDWATPPALYCALDQEFAFTLDVAASPTNAKHERYVTKDVDALAISWAHERVFCNPPYGRVLDRWMYKAFHEASENGALVVMLVPSRTDTRWFHLHVLPHAEIRFIRGRLNYTRGAHSGRSRAPFASMICIYRPHSHHEGRITTQYVFPFLSKSV
jgi:phage N-6-adenine-methyltransferase